MFLFKRKSTSKTAALVVLVVMFLLMSILFGALGISNLGEKTVVDADSVTYSEFNTENEYYFKELTLVDQYVYFLEDTESNIVERDFLVCFIDKDGELCYASLEVAKEDDISGICIKYLNDENAGVGDVVLSGCFSCYALDKQSDDIDSDFEIAYDKYQADLPGKKTNLHFKYDAENAEAFAEKRSTEGTIFLVAATVFFLISATVIAVTLISYKKSKKITDIVTEDTSCPNLMGSDDQQ